MTPSPPVRAEKATTRFYHRFARGLRRLVPFCRRQLSAIEARFGYRVPAFDMGDVGGDRVRGIFSPRYDADVVRKYIQPQFLEYAETYAQKYDNFDFYKYLLGRAFGLVGMEAAKRRGLKILDIGSGSGNTIFPLLELCPDSDVLGSDLSLEIMVLLKQALIRKGLAEQCYLLQLNAEELDFRRGTFDLVVGGAILHHLFRPDHAIASCARILKKGGHAIFFEPFQEGFVELRDCYAEVLADARAASLPAQVRDFFQAIVNDVNVRLGTDKSAPLYQRLDDKWYFPRAYFQDLARKHKFARCLIDSFHDSETQLEKETEVLLRLAIQQPREVAPAWVWQVIEKHDNAVPKDRKRELLLEACLVFQR